jgi:prefoldin subunit 5
MTDKPSAPERVQATYRQLSAAATGLNAASNELGKTITELDTALKQLNLGISAWVLIANNKDEDGSYWSRSIGYTKIGSEWVIALRDLSGHDSWDEDQVEVWRFNDAPRWMRIESIGMIPQLLEDLTKRADDTAKQVKKKTAEAKELTAAIKAAAEESNPMNKLTAPPPPMTPPPFSSKAAARLPLAPPPSPARK